MTELHDVELRGCTPELLMSYLKALGVFRLVAEQKDADARAWWENDTFFLHSTLDREELTGFFLDKYKPTPIVSPWNNRYRTDVMKSKGSPLSIFLSLTDRRFSGYQQAIEMSRDILECEGFRSRSIPSKGSEKTRFLSKCRGWLSDESLAWFDVAYVLSQGDPDYPPLTGGNGGSLGTSASGDISINFAKNLAAALGLNLRRGKSDTAPKDLLNAALFGDTSSSLSKASGGQFKPGGGGPNASIGFEGDALVNSWDFVLMCEGIVVLAGASTRRLSAGSRSKAVFPFTVDTSAAGYGTAISEEYRGKSRAEFWAPLWSGPATLQEVSHVLAEGRAQLGGQQASNGTAFARAIAGLGTERGVASFQRFGFLQRTGKDGVFASPIGRLTVKVKEESDLLFDLDQWLDMLRRNLRGRNPPAELGSMFSRLDDAIIEFCQRGQPRDLQNVLIAIGKMERWLGKSSIRDKIDPLDSLSWEWVEHAKDDDTMEFRLARSLASVLQEPRNGQPQVGPIRENLESVRTHQYQRTKWDDANRSFVWTVGDPLSNMLAVLTRRCLDGRTKGVKCAPLDSRYSVQLNDIVAFLHGDVDYQRIADLALPLSFIRYDRRQSVSEFHTDAPPDLPAAYAAMKLTLLPRCKFVCPEFQADTEIRMEPSIPALLRTGRVRDAYDRTYRRLWASGLRPLTDNPGISDGSEQARRLAAALLFPLDKTANNALAQRALRQPELASN